jgi:hypothetical protein
MTHWTREAAGPTQTCAPKTFTFFYNSYFIFLNLVCSRKYVYLVKNYEVLFSPKIKAQGKKKLIIMSLSSIKNITN